jgi:hypothetical protein
MRNARKHLVWILGLALALGVSGVAQATSQQHLEASINKTGLPKKKFTKGVALSVHTSTTGTADVGPAPLLPAQTQTADIHFGKDFKFTSKGLPQCNQNDPAIQSGNTAQAIAACGPGGTASGGGDSIVGDGTATAETLLAPPNDVVPVVVTAFNGLEQNGNPTIILHSRAESLNNTTPLVGELQGTTLHVPVPQLAAGIATLTDFQTTVEKKYKPAKAKKKKKKNYVSARCKSKKKGIVVSSDWTYYDGAPPAHADNETPIKCKPKK